MNAKKKHSTKIIGIILLFLGICVISFTAYHFFKNDAKSKTPNSKTSEEIPQTEKPSGNNPDELLNYSFQIYQLPEDAYSTTIYLWLIPLHPVRNYPSCCLSC